eukprot:11111108-Alexandrium_andersonii.AAC.1
MLRQEAYTRVGLAWLPCAARPWGRVAAGRLADPGVVQGRAVLVAGTAARPTRLSTPAERVRPWAFGGRPGRIGTCGLPSSWLTTRRCWVLWHQPSAGRE